MQFDNHPQANFQPFVSIIVSVRNEERTIKRCIQSLMSQSYETREIIVIDGESEDKTPQIVQKFPVKYERIKHIEGIAAARPRKIGLTMASGSIVFFPEADAYYEPQFIEKCIRHFQDQVVAGVFGCMRMWKFKDTIMARIRELNYRFYEINPQLVRKKAAKGLIAGWFMRKEILDQIGIDDSMYGEDTSWTRDALKMGYRLEYEPSALWWHNLPDTLANSMRHQYNMGKLSAKTTSTETKGQSKFKKYWKMYTPKLLYFLAFPFLLALCIISFFYFYFIFSYLLIIIGLLIVIPYLRKMVRLNSARKDKKDILAILVYPFISLLLNYSFIIGLIIGFIKS